MQYLVLARVKFDDKKGIISLSKAFNWLQAKDIIKFHAR